MEQRISLVTLGVADLRRARDFYEAGLGWVPTNVMDQIVFYQAGGLVFALWARDALAADAGLDDREGGFGGIAFAHNVRSREQVHATLADAAAAGAKILKPAKDTDWGGYAGYFADFDGHPWEVAWNPHWTLAKDGSVVLPTTD